MTNTKAGHRRLAHKPVAPLGTSVATPDQYDRLRAPTWTTGPAPAARAGANDHQRHRSAGNRC